MQPACRVRRMVFRCLSLLAGLAGAAFANPLLPGPVETSTTLPREQLGDPPAAPDAWPPSVEGARAVSWVRGRFTSIQVNVSPAGNNIVNDAANEPSIAVDPTDPNRMAIGWRQFNSITSDFRQAGWGYSQDAGQTWTFPGVLEAQFRSDPILQHDADGVFYYNSLRTSPGFICDVFRSDDGGVTWTGPVFAYGGDKAWMTVDRTTGAGRGHVYTAWNRQFGCPTCGVGWFNRSIDGAASFQAPVSAPDSLRWGTISVGPDGEVFVVGTSNFSGQISVLRSPNAQNAIASPTFDVHSFVNLNGSQSVATGPNPAGLLGQIWIATDHSTGPSHGNVYVLSSVNPAGFDPLDVMFARSTDGGLTWDPPVRINDDPPHSNVWQWFGTMDVAPNGRIDVIWNDTRVSPTNSRISELYYSFSEDGGLTWSPNVPVSPSFDSWLGWPNQAKLGDYYDMVSDNTGANVAYAATFNFEQDVYFLRIGFDCNGNDIADDDEIADNSAADCNANGIPDECDVARGDSPDCDINGIPDECDPDADGDGHIDACDNCPALANSGQADSDADGAGDPCDGCPNDPGKIAPGDCGCGVPDDDTDGDGTADCLDGCPLDPNKVDPGICGCGAAETGDSDGDGTIDCVDQCPGADDTLFAPGCVGAIPAASEWGLLILALLLLAGAKIAFTCKLDAAAK